MGKDKRMEDEYLRKFAIEKAISCYPFLGREKPLLEVAEEIYQFLIAGRSKPTFSYSATRFAMGKDDMAR